MDATDVLVISSDRFVDHATPHPEQPARAEVLSRVASRWRAAGGRVATPTPALPAVDVALAAVRPALRPFWRTLVTG